METGFTETSTDNGMYRYQYVVPDTRKEKIESLAFDLFMKKRENKTAGDGHLSISEDMREAVSEAKFFYDEIDRVTSEANEDSEESEELHCDTLSTIEKILKVIIKYEKTDDEKETAKSLKKIIKIMEKYKNK